MFQTQDLLAMSNYPTIGHHLDHDTHPVPIVTYITTFTTSNLSESQIRLPSSSFQVLSSLPLPSPTSERQLPIGKKWHFASSLALSMRNAVSVVLGDSLKKEK